MPWYWTDWWIGGLFGEWIKTGQSAVEDVIFLSTIYWLKPVCSQKHMIPLLWYVIKPPGDSSRTLSIFVIFVWKCNIVFLPPAGALQLHQESEAAVDAVSYPVLTCCQFIHLFLLCDSVSVKRMLLWLIAHWLSVDTKLTFNQV